MFKTPLVSVVIPTYNRLFYLQEAVDSVINQTYSNIEIIICDNASTDKTFEFFMSNVNKKIIYIRHEKGLFPLDNWNSWTDKANGEYITFLPDDDKLAPTFIEKCVKAFLEDKDTKLVKAGCFVMDGNSKVTGEYIPFKDNKSSGYQFFLDRINPRYAELSLGSGYAFRKDDFILVGGFMLTGFPKMHYVDDYLWYRLSLERGNVSYLNEKLWYYRDHTSNMALVESLSDFRDNFRVYIPILLKMLKDKKVTDPEIIYYIQNTYPEKMIKDRVLGELSRNRRKKIVNSITFINRNCNIIIEYFGVKKLLIEYTLSFLLSKWF